jgi:hypothetical protein
MICRISYIVIIIVYNLDINFLTGTFGFREKKEPISIPCPHSKPKKQPYNLIGTHEQLYGQYKANWRYHHCSRFG